MAIQGKIQINTGTYSDTCTTENDLILNAAKSPAVRDMMDYVNRRSLSTFLTSGGVTPYGVDNPNKSKIKVVDGKLIGNSGYKYNVMGRIEKSTNILSQVGASGADGTFTLKMEERYLHVGDVVMFNGQRLQARVMTSGSGSPALGYTYTFQTMDGTVFVYATHVAGQAGTKTCMPVHTAFGEKSLRGYGKSRFPDTFINFTTIQRNTTAITGGAGSDILIYKYQGVKGEEWSGWMYQEVSQNRARFVYENERQKWFGVSNMKNSDGSVKAVPSMIDNETGMFIQTGDGWEMQVAGGNVLYGSASDGMWTLQDLTDLMMALELQSDSVNGVNWVGVTGTKGYSLVQQYGAQLAGNQNTTFMQNVTQDGRVGGGMIDAGFEFQRYNINGNSITFVKHTLFDDRLMFTELDSSGYPLQSSTVFIMNVGVGTNLNMEIVAKGANGFNRSEVNAKINGMTGSSEVGITTEEDALKVAMLKEDLFAVINAMCCGILRPTAI